MKILGTIALTVVVLVSSLVVFLSSVCAFSSGFGASGRLSFAICAAVALAVDVAAIWGIARLNRKT
jgi:hypothetical protein